jgi:hypothetical protein
MKKENTIHAKGKRYEMKSTMNLKMETWGQSNKELRLQSRPNPQQVFLGKCLSQHQMTKIQIHKNNLFTSYPDQIYIDKQHTNDFGWELCKNMKQTKINF